MYVICSVGNDEKIDFISGISVHANGNMFLLQDDNLCFGWRHQFQLVCQIKQLAAKCGFPLCFPLNKKFWGLPKT